LRNDYRMEQLKQQRYDDSIRHVTVLNDKRYHDSIENRIISEASKDGTVYVGNNMQIVSPKAKSVVEGYDKKISDVQKNCEKIVQNVYSRANEAMENVNQKTADLEKTVDKITNAYEAKVKEITATNTGTAIAQNALQTASNEARTAAYTPTTSNSAVTARNNTYGRTVNYNTTSRIVIDVDKSERTIDVYAEGNDGNITSLGIYSRASFPSNGGPLDGVYNVKNKGRRSGELYPGFLAIDDPVGISGEGENRAHLDEILEGRNANKSGLRVPNSVFDRLANLVDTKNTVVYVHE
jgi:hypothetical protein